MKILMNSSYVRLVQNQLFTININKGGIDDDEPDETEH